MISKPATIYRDRARGDEVPCVLCGKGIKPGAGVGYLHIHGGGALIVTEEEAARMSAAGDMGMQPIGRECLRQHPELRPYLAGAARGRKEA